MMWGIWNAEGRKLESVLSRTDCEEYWLFNVDSIDIYILDSLDNLLYAIEKNGLTIERIL